MDITNRRYPAIELVTGQDGDDKLGGVILINKKGR